MCTVREDLIFRELASSVLRVPGNPTLLHWFSGKLLVENNIASGLIERPVFTVIVTSCSDAQQDAKLPLTTVSLPQLWVVLAIGKSFIR